MKRRAIILPAADRDLRQVAAYLAKNRRGYGARFARSAHQCFRQLAAMPGLGGPWETEDPGLTGLRRRQIPGFENYLASYRATDEGIEVIRVLHGARDIDTLLEGEGDEGRGGA